MCIDTIGFFFDLIGRQPKNVVPFDNAGLDPPYFIVLT